MATSYNGWRVLSSSQPVRFTAGGRSWYAANRDVAIVFAYLINRFDAEVESVDGGQLDDWSFAVRPVRGQEASATNMSCHSSATAVDINATKHPRFAHGTFSSAKTAAVRRILAAINHDDQIIRWGSDYVSAPIDSMHFEIVAGERSVRQAADRLRQLQEDDVTPADIAKIVDGVADEVMRRLSGNHVIPNQKVSISDKPASDMTFVGAISNIELNQDQQIKADGEHFKALSGKLDQVIGALKNAPKVTLNQK
jgi:hypothetical protein